MNASFVSDKGDLFTKVALSHYFFEKFVIKIA